MLPELIPSAFDAGSVCRMAAKWKIDPDLAWKLAKMQDSLPGLHLQIISGFRTREHQLALKRAGRPAADPDVSTHCSCPATGADLRFEGIEADKPLKARFGEAAYLVGLRWGGGSPVDPMTGIPSDWNHVDLGPRR